MKQDNIKTISRQPICPLEGKRSANIYWKVKETKENKVSITLEKKKKETNTVSLYTIGLLGLGFRPKCYSASL